MLSISDSVKKAYNNYTTQRKSYIKAGNNSFFIQNLDISADCYNEGNIIGNAIAKIIKFDIETVYVKDLDEFELFDGIWTGNQYEYISLGTFKLFDEEGVDDFFSSITAYDKLILFNKTYDPKQTNFPTTLYGFLKNICLQANVELENIFIPNGEQLIDSNLFVENETLKTILNAICQINGCFGIISQDKLKLLLKGSDSIVLSKFQISNPEYKRTTWNINQVVLGMTDVDGEYVLKQDDEDIVQNGIHKLVINDNPFVYTQELRERYIDNLFNQVKGFGYIAFETEWEGLPYIELGDLISIDGKESIILRYNIKSPNGLESTLSAPSIIDSVVEYVDNSNSISNQQKRTELKVDKQNQEIQAIASKVVDVSATVENIGSIKLENSATADLYNLTIKGNVSLLYPSRQKIGQVGMKSGSYKSGIKKASSFIQHYDALYPSPNLYTKNLKLKIQNGENITYIKLPNFILRQKGNVFDEFQINTNVATVIRRIKLNYDGTTSVLNNPVIEKLGTIDLALQEGENIISLPSFPSAKLSATYLTKNDYTNVFATKVEVSSQIKVGTDNILLESKSYTDSATDGDTLISKINLDSTGKVKIQASKTIDLTGTDINLTANQMTITSKNFQVDTEGNMNCFSGTFAGNLNTTEDAHIGNNLYIGENQSGSTFDIKTITLSDDAYIQRTYNNVMDKSHVDIKADGGVRLFSEDFQSRVYASVDGYGGSAGLSVRNPNNYEVGFGANPDSIGMYYQSHRIYMSEDGIFYSEQPTISSDKRLKENIKDADVSFIDELQVKEFEYTNSLGKKQIGLIAQDYIDKDYSQYFLDTFKNPDKNNEQYYGITYGNITNALIKYCQELKKEINDLKEEVNLLKESDN